MRRSLPLLLLAAVLALALAACGTESGSSGASFSGDAKDVADTVDDLSKAGKGNDAKKICDEILAGALQKKVAQGGASCDDEVDKAIGDADDFDLDVQTVKVTGATATAQVRGRIGQDEKVRTMALEKINGAWRITSLGG
jgi:hypothetical protein